MGDAHTRPCKYQTQLQLGCTLLAAPAMEAVLTPPPPDDASEHMHDPSTESPMPLSAQPDPRPIGIEHPDNKDEDSYWGDEDFDLGEYVPPWPREGISFSIDLNEGAMWRIPLRGGSRITTREALETVAEAIAVSAHDRSRVTQISQIATSVRTYDIGPDSTILFASASAHFDLLHPTSIREWVTINAPKIVMHVFHCKPGRISDPTERNSYMHGRLMHALAGIRLWTHDPTVFGVAPRPSERAVSLALHSKAFLLAGGRPETLAKVLSHRVVSFASLTVAFFPFELSIPALATRLSGFAPHTTTNDVRRIVTRSWTRDPTRTIIAGTLTQLLGMDVTGRGSTTVDEWAARIRVTRVRGERESTFAVLTDAPAPSAADFYLFRRAIHEAPLSSCKVDM
jgi:hypothetical protein